LQYNGGAAVYPSSTIASGVTHKRAVENARRQAANVRPAAIFVGIVIPDDTPANGRRPALEVESPAADGVIAASGRAVIGKAIGIA